MGRNILFSPSLESGEFAQFQLSSIRWTAIKWTCAREDTCRGCCARRSITTLHVPGFFPLRPAMNRIRALVAYSASLYPRRLSEILPEVGAASNRRLRGSFNFARVVLHLCVPSPPLSRKCREDRTKLWRRLFMPFLTHVTFNVKIFLGYIYACISLLSFY